MVTGIIKDERVAKTRKRKSKYGEYAKWISDSLDQLEKGSTLFFPAKSEKGAKKLRNAIRQYLNDKQRFDITKGVLTKLKSRVDGKSVAFFFEG